MRVSILPTCPQLFKFMELGIKDLTLHINSLGNSSSRENYITALKVFLKERK